MWRVEKCLHDACVYHIIHMADLAHAYDALVMCFGWQDFRLELILPTWLMNWPLFSIGKLLSSRNRCMWNKYNILATEPRPRKRRSFPPTRSQRELGDGKRWEKTVDEKGKVSACCFSEESLGHEVSGRKDIQKVGSVPRCVDTDSLTGLDGRRSRESCTWQEPCGIHHWWLVDLTKLSPGHWLHEWSGGHHLGGEYYNTQPLGSQLKTAQVFNKYWQGIVMDLALSVTTNRNCRALWGDLDQNTWDPSRSLE